MAYGWILGLNPRKAMNRMNANVQAHVDFSTERGKVFWDRNKRFPDKVQSLLRGGYLYLWEAGGRGITYRFHIDDLFDGRDDFERILDDPTLRTYLPSWRAYEGEDRRKVLAGEKCGSFILCRDPVEVGPIDLSNLRTWKGKRVRAKVVRGSGIGILVEDDSKSR
jgi:hypothetical protein